MFKFSPFPKMKTWRSEKHRRNVAALPCLRCGIEGRGQCAHANFSKGLSLKASDAIVMSLCYSCHALHDSGGIYGSKEARWAQEVVYVDRTRAELIARGQWSPEIEKAYRAAYEPMRRAAEVSA